jgi:hypothetical protein
LLLDLIIERERGLTLLLRWYRGDSGQGLMILPIDSLYTTTTTIHWYLLLRRLIISKTVSKDSMWTNTAWSQVEVIKSLLVQLVRQKFICVSADLVFKSSCPVFQWIRHRLSLRLIGLQLLLLQQFDVSTNPLASGYLVEYKFQPFGVRLDHLFKQRRWVLPRTRVSVVNIDHLQNLFSDVCRLLQFVLIWLALTLLSIYLASHLVKLFIVSKPSIVIIDLQLPLQILLNSVESAAVCLTSFVMLMGIRRGLRAPVLVG